MIQYIQGGNMIHNYKSTSTLDLSFDDQTNELIVNDGIIVDESLVRKLKDMDKLFNDASNLDRETPLYYMYNGIYRPEHKDLFKNAGIKYEYTLLLPNLINGECIKAHGHMHGVSEITKTNYLEIYEVLGGEGYFQLFKFNDKKIDVVLVSVKVGDIVIIPPGYYHLSVNTGNSPFNFGDLIVDDAKSDYGLLKVYDGAPYFFMKNENGEVSYKYNSKYNDYEINLMVVDANNVPWDIPYVKGPLYSHFVSDPKYYEFLK